MKRRDFLKYGAAVGSMAAGRSLVGSPVQQNVRSHSMWEKDLALVNASIVTLDPARPQAEAALVRNGRIALVGSTEEVLAGAGSARVYDAACRTVVPGFVDAHCHMEVTSSPTPASRWRGRPSRRRAAKTRESPTSSIGSSTVATTARRRT